MIKDTGEQPDEELHIHRVRFGRLMSVGASVSVELGYVTLQVHGCVPQPGCPWDPILLGFLWKLYHVGTINY